jgi:AraC-like DNA-binding protein
MARSALGMGIPSAFQVAMFPGQAPGQAALPQPAILPGPWPPVVYYQTGPGQESTPGRTVLVSGQMTVDSYAGGLLLDRIPPAVKIDSTTATARRLGPVLDLLSAEAADPAALGALVIQRQLTHVLLVQALRAVMATSTRPTGWLAALADEQIGAALAQIHAQPDRHWTVAELARAASMSRSAFAARFRALAGLPPLEYLITWRMHLAAHELRTTSRSAGSIGAAVGYPAETTFSTTFKRVMGQPPARYRNQTRLAPRNRQAASAASPPRHTPSSTLPPRAGLHRPAEPRP